MGPFGLCIDKTLSALRVERQAYHGTKAERHSHHHVHITRSCSHYSFTHMHLTQWYVHIHTRARGLASSGLLCGHLAVDQGVSSCGLAQCARCRGPRCVFGGLSFSWCLWWSYVCVTGVTVCVCVCVLQV